LVTFQKAKENEREIFNPRKNRRCTKGLKVSEDNSYTIFVLGLFLLGLFLVGVGIYLSTYYQIQTVTFPNTISLWTTQPYWILGAILIIVGIVLVVGVFLVQWWKWSKQRELDEFIQT
jgi:phosphoglycerol transferase MdoB-like AlkP superfamily enzyme